MPAGGLNLDIPPGEIAVTQQMHVIACASTAGEFPAAYAHARQGHVDERRYIPMDGRSSLSHVNNFQWNWHVNYIYADHAAPIVAGGHDAS